MKIMFACLIILSTLAQIGKSYPAEYTGSIQTNIIAPFSNLHDASLEKISAITNAKTSLLPSFPDSGRHHVVLEQESIPSKLDSKYTQLQQVVANLLHPKPIVDTIEEHEKYGNDGDKLRSIGTFLIGQYEGLSNVLNTAVELPLETARQLGKKVTSSLNSIGGKLVGL